MNLTLQTKVVGVKDTYLHKPLVKVKKYEKSEQTTQKTLIEKCIREEQ